MDFIKSKSASKIFYYLMSVDGKVTADEVDTFNEIGIEADKHSFENYKEGIIKECEEQISRVTDSKSLYDIIHEAVMAELEFKEEMVFELDFDSRRVSTKWLVWNMLALAYSDKDYAEVERNLIVAAVEKIGLDNAYFFEMEHLMKSAKAVEKELTWIKTANKSYAEISNIVEELELRKNTILKSVKELIKD